MEGYLDPLGCLLGKTACQSVRACLLAFSMDSTSPENPSCLGPSVHLQSELKKEKNKNNSQNPSFGEVPEYPVHSLVA